MKGHSKDFERSFAAKPLAETPLEKLDAVREWVKDGIGETLASEGGEFILGIESASVLAALSDIEKALTLIAEQVSLYEMSYSDTLGPSADSFIACIANILEYGHPAGEQDA